MMDIGFSVCAVLPAAGSGERFGAVHPKQFSMLMDRPLVSYTLEAFENLKWIEHIVLVISECRKAEVEEILKKFNHKRVSIAIGQSARHRSIFNGIKALTTEGLNPQVVIIHDAVRPFVESDILRGVAEAAYEHGASGAIRPLVSTVIAATPEGILEESLDRSKYKASEMPQAFQYEVINKAYRSCTDFDLDYGTECLHLAKKYCGVKARLIEGDPNLWKVTHKRDIYAAEGMIKEKYKKVVLSGEVPTDEVLSSLETALSKHVLEVVHAPDLKEAVDSTQDYVCVMYFTNDFQSVHLDQLCTSVLSGRQKSTTCGIVVILLKATHGNECTSLERSVMKTAGTLREERVYLNLIKVEVEGSDDYSCLQPFAELAAEISFHRNMVFTGQSFRTRLK